MWIIILVWLAVGAPDADKMVNLPGYPTTFPARAFAGYLDTQSSNRKLHYVFIESTKGQNNTEAVTLWMEGGPGCASKLGLLQQIPPYYLPLNTAYNLGDDLKPNAYSWHNLSNLLFIDSPAGVGFSINVDRNYTYNDLNTLKDNIAALKHFFNDKFPQYRNNPFYISGISYAGKYIPDLAEEILYNYNVLNKDAKINLKGILVGNGVLNLQKNSLLNNQMQFIISHNFLDPKIVTTWERACKVDSDSAGCKYYYTRYNDLVGDLNHYNLYGPCFNADSLSNQRNFLLKISSPSNTIQSGCNYDLGIERYFNNNHDLFKTNITNLVVCNQTIFDSYAKTPTCSMPQMARLILGGLIRVYLFNGDWDSVVPFTDTINNLQLLNLKQQKPSEPWFVNGQHAGFVRTYNNGLKFITVKGAGHQVPLYQRQRSYEVFRMFLQD